MHAGLAALHVAIGHYSGQNYKVDLAGGQVSTYDMCSALDETGDGPPFNVSGLHWQLACYSLQMFP